MGLSILKEFEGLRLDAYQDVGGYWTIGYGTRIETGPASITLELAEQMLQSYLRTLERRVYSILEVKVNENQYAALLCFSYNVGFSALKYSTLLKYLNEGYFNEAADEFLKWDHVKSVVDNGILKRRAVERALFLKFV